LPNPSFQLTAWSFGFITVFGVATGFGLSDFFQQTPAATELGRSAGTKQKCCPRRTLGAELRSSRLVSAPRQKKNDDNKQNQIISCAEQGARVDVHSSACLKAASSCPPLSAER